MSARAPLLAVLFARDAPCSPHHYLYSSLIHTGEYSTPCSWAVRHLTQAAGHLTQAIGHLI